MKDRCENIKRPNMFKNGDKKWIDRQRNPCMHDTGKIDEVGSIRNLNQYDK